jgi:hypothetical protein
MVKKIFCRHMDQAKNSVAPIKSSRYFFLVLALFVVGLVSVVAAAPPDPYFPNGDYSQSNYYWPTGGIYAHEIGKEVTNGGGAGNVYYSFYGDHYPLSSVLFWMEPNETVKVWAYYSGAARGGYVYMNVRCATAADGNISDIRVERYDPPPHGASIRVITPNGGENWSSGETRTITWNTTGLEGTHVGIDLCRWDGSAWVVKKGIIGGLSATNNSYDWVIPPLPAPASYKIKIASSEYHGLPNDLSDNSFTAGGSDITPPQSVTGLHNTTYADSYIKWTWTDPTDVDFDHVMVYFGGKLQGGNFVFGYFNASGLSANTQYTVGTRTVDTVGNVNLTWVNHTARTRSLPVTNTADKIGVYNNGVWYLDNDGSGTWNAGDRANSFGATGWTSVVGDWNGDNKAEIGVYKDGVWYLDNDGSGTWNAGDRANSFGSTGWTSVVGNWNGDTKAEIGVYKDGVWYLDNDGSGTWNAGDKAFNFGALGWTPVLGDWNGDNKTEVGVYQNGVWYLDNDGSGTWNAGDWANNFGATGWTSVVGKWS